MNRHLRKLFCLRVVTSLNTVYAYVLVLEIILASRVYVKLLPYKNLLDLRVIKLFLL